MTEPEQQDPQQAARERRKVRLIGFLVAVLIAVLIAAMQMIDIYADSHAHHTVAPPDAAEQ